MAVVGVVAVCGAVVVDIDDAVDGGVGGSYGTVDGSVGGKYGDDDDGNAGGGFGGHGYRGGRVGGMGGGGGEVLNVMAWATRGRRSTAPVSGPC